MGMDEQWLKNARFLIVDDQAYNIDLLERILRRAGFSNLRSTIDSQQLEPLFHEFAPDIVLLDLHMPEIDGFEALGRIRKWDNADSYLPVLVLTADITKEAKQRALQGGANDFLTKPLDKSEVILRVNNLLNTRWLHLRLQHQNDNLEERVRKRTEELTKAKYEILQLLARVSEFRDDVTGIHTQRVGYLSGQIAQMLGLPASEAELIRLAAPLHDLGKIGIRDEVLLKPGTFTPEEFEQMKLHTTIGSSILEGSIFPVLAVAATIALSHHEKWNGAGYPHGLKGVEIPLAARIVALADFYDALTHERPYKRAWSKKEAVAEIEWQRGIHFDPQVVDAFLLILQEKDNYESEQERVLL